MADGSTAIGAAFAAGAALAAVAWLGLRWQRRRLASDRLFEAAEVADDTEVRPAPPQLGAAARNLGRLVAVTFGVAVALVLSGLGLVGLELAAAFGFLGGVALVAIHDGLLARRAQRVEAQVADGLDLIVAALRAGTSLVDALEAASRELAAPVGDVLAEVSGRLRLGEPIEEVMADFQALLPVESVRLVAQVLLVQARTGGALAPALGSISRAVRDRIELARRIRAQSAEVAFSVVAVMVVTYAIAWLSWTTAPDRVEAFLASTAGGGLLAACVFLQGFGILWIRRLGRVPV